MKRVASQHNGHGTLGRYMRQSDILTRMPFDPWFCFITPTRSPSYLYSHFKNGFGAAESAGTFKLYRRNDNNTSVQVCIYLFIVYLRILMTTIRLYGYMQLRYIFLKEGVVLRAYVRQIQRVNMGPTCIFQYKG